MTDLSKGSTQLRTAVEANNIPMSVFFWLADRQACGVYRGLQPLKALAQKHGVQVEVNDTSTLPYTILVAQRTHKQDCVDLLEYIKENRQTISGSSVPKIVYEVDDDLWSLESDNPAYEYYSNQEVYDNGIKAIKLSDAVTVSTEPLAEVIRQWNQNVHVLPNSIPRRYVNELVYPYKIKPAGEPFVIGWAGGHTHLRDFKTIAANVSTFLKFYPNSRFVFFGTDYSNLLDPSVGSQIRVAPWMNSVDKFRDFLGRAGIDVLLAPLYRSRFNQSKSNLRLIEAAALGIPTIAVNWGPYSADKNGNQGTLYIDEGVSWTGALSELEGSPMKRLEMSAAGRQWIEQGYIQEDNSDKWLAAYRQILGG